MVVSQVAAKTAAVQLNEQSNGVVVLTTADSDRFIRTQREIVSAMRGADDIMAKSRKASEDFSVMIKDVVAWCGQRPQITSCTFCPRIDDILVVLQSSDEDDNGALDDAISLLDLELFQRNKFRISWLMLRASEAKGIGCFVGNADARCIYSAK